MKYYNEVRTHLFLDKYAPIPRAVGTVGHILCLPVLGGLYHQYVRDLIYDGHSFVLAVLASTFKSKSRLEAENAVL